MPGAGSEANWPFPNLSNPLEWILISHSRFSGLQIIGEELEKKIDYLLANNQVPEAERFQAFLVKSYLDINDKQAAGWVNVKLAKFHGQMGNHEKQLSLLQETTQMFQGVDSEALKAYSELLEEQLSLLSVDIFQNEFISL